MICTFTRRFFINVIMCGAGDARKLVILLYVFLTRETLVKLVNFKKMAQPPALVAQLDWDRAVDWMGFLTVLLDGQVVLGHSLGLFISGSSHPTPAHSRIFCFAGEKVGSKLSPAYGYGPACDGPCTLVLEDTRAVGAQHYRPHATQEWDIMNNPSTSRSLHIGEG
jgi:hypothetical protein